MTTTAQRYLTDAQIAGYHRDGYLAVPRLIETDRVEALRRLTDAFVERARGVSRSDAVFDLDPRHGRRAGPQANQEPGRSRSALRVGGPGVAHPRRRGGADRPLAPLSPQQAEPQRRPHW